MQAIEKFITEIESKLPSVCSASDLIGVGISTRPTLCRMRQNGTGPAFFRIHRKKVQYLKDDVLTWVRSNYNKGNK